ncbi:MAG: EAL domain-containing protein [Lachnospiraceae bacterium]|nr:EAL domain-containing protein [Lachnospiraceae bacterium]
MKVAFMVLLGIAAIVLLNCIYKTSKSNEKIANPMIKLLRSSLVAVCLNFVIMILPIQWLSNFLYSLYFGNISWMMYFMLCFSLYYIGSAPEKHIKIPLMRLMISVDCVSLMLNSIFGHAFTTKLYDTWGTGFCYVPVHGFYMQIHGFIVHMLMAFIFIALSYQTVKAPRVYKRKYLYPLVLLLIVIFLDLMHHLELNPVDISVIGYGIGSIILYYYALNYQPKALARHSLGLVLDDMVESVFLFDAEGTCIRVNEAVHQMFPMEDAIERIEREFAKWKKQADIRECSGKSWEWSFEREGKEKHYFARYHSLYDEKKRYLGSFWTVRDRTEIVEELHREHFRATHDHLTGLYNEEWFYEKVKEALHDETEEAFYIVCSDIQNFKFINDIFGKQVGDELLIKMAGRLKDRVALGGIYGHLEQDRFALLIKKRDFEPNIFKDIPKEVHTNKELSYPVNIFLGVYEVTDRTMPVSEMCEHAIMAVHTLKGRFNLEIAYYDEDLRASVLKEQELTSDLDRALANKEIQIYLQPQITSDDKMVGAEALVRWLHPTRGMVMPGEFIEIFENNGLIVKLDQYIWRLACEHLKRWKESGWGDKYISVNISPTDFHFIDIYDTFIELIEEYQINPKNLRLEITETAVITNLEKQLELIEKLRDAGFIVEMDDFGSGYSSLNMLKDIRVDVLKFDLHFLRNSNDIERSRKIIKSLMILSHELDMPAISEGVETKEQVEFLKGIGCNLFQGYYFAKPMDVKTFEEKYR